MNKVTTDTPSHGMPFTEAWENFDSILNAVTSVVIGKRKEAKAALSCLLAGGHLLIEDIPGIGKTTLAKVLAKTLGLEFARIQCTSDMLPGDILGASVFEQVTGSFVFHKGPVFTQLLLADEINRTTPKTQSALLEAMEECQVTIEGDTYPLDSPFFVIATQNPFEQSGTYPLPESQLDRFLMRIELGYPDQEAEKEVLLKGGGKPALEKITAILTPEEVVRIQKEVSEVHVSPVLADYVQQLLIFSRSSGYFQLGLSPRAGLSIIQASRAWAYLQGRSHVLPEDVQRILPYTAGHRLLLAEKGKEPSMAEIEELFRQVPVPT